MNSANPTSGASILVKNEMPKDVDCPICLEPFNGRTVKPVIVKTQCDHYFDEDCITNWLNSPNAVSRSCTVCRQPSLPLQRESGARLYEHSRFIEAKPLQDCRNGDLDALQELLRIDPSIVHHEFRAAVPSRYRQIGSGKFRRACSGRDVILLRIAIEENHLGCVQALLTSGANPNVIQILNRMPMLQSAMGISKS